MISSRKKPEIRVLRDGRVILSGSAYAKMKLKLRELADSKCERCGKFTLQGDVEHVRTRGIGGGKRDDRVFVDGKRQLLYLCRKCHGGRHVPEKVVPAKMNDAEFDSLLGLPPKENSL